MNKTFIPKRIKNLAKSFGVTFRVGPTPESVDIIYAGNLPENFVAAYFGEGVVYVKDYTSHERKDMNIALLHELGHAILDFFPLKMSDEIEEVKANAIALAFAAQLRLPVSNFIIKNFNQYVRGI